jgi:hypothetical protein
LYTTVSEHTSSRLSDYSLVKELKSRSFLKQSSLDNFRHPRRVFLEFPSHSSGRLSRLGEANTIVRFLPVNGSFRFSFRRLLIALLFGYDVNSTSPKQQPSDDKISGQVNYHLGRTKAAPVIPNALSLGCTGYEAWQRATEAF